MTAATLPSGLLAAHLSRADSTEGTVPCFSATAPMTSGVTSCLRTLKAAFLSGQLLEMPKPEPWMTARGCPVGVGRTATPRSSPRDFSKVPYIQGPSTIMAAVPFWKAPCEGPSASAALGAAATPSLATRSKANCMPSTNFCSVMVTCPSRETSPPKAMAKSPAALAIREALTARPYLPSPVRALASLRNCSVV